MERQSGFQGPFTAFKLIGKNNPGSYPTGPDIESVKRELSNSLANVKSELFLLHEDNAKEKARLQEADKQIDNLKWETGHQEECMGLMKVEKREMLATHRQLRKEIQKLKENSRVSPPPNTSDIDVITKTPIPEVTITPWVENGTRQPPEKPDKKVGKNYSVQFLLGNKPQNETTKPITITKKLPPDISNGVATITPTHHIPPKADAVPVCEARKNRQGSNCKIKILPVTETKRDPIKKLKKPRQSVKFRTAFACTKPNLKLQAFYTWWKHKNKCRVCGCHCPNSFALVDHWNFGECSEIQTTVPRRKKQKMNPTSVSPFKVPGVPIKSNRVTVATSQGAKIANGNPVDKPKPLGSAIAKDPPMIVVKSGRRHRLIPDGTEVDRSNFKFNCYICGIQFQYLSPLKKHMARCHNEPGYLKNFAGGCKLCGVLFERDQDHWTHYAEVHKLQQSPKTYPDDAKTVQ